MSAKPFDHAELRSGCGDMKRSRTNGPVPNRSSSCVHVRFVLQQELCHSLVTLEGRGMQWGDIILATYAGLMSEQNRCYQFMAVSRCQEKRRAAAGYSIHRSVIGKEEFNKGLMTKLR